MKQRFAASNHKMIGVKASFENGQQSQMKMFESFKIRQQLEKEEQSIEESESMSNYGQLVNKKLGSLKSEDEIKNELKFPFSINAAIAHFQSPPLHEQSSSNQDLHIDESPLELAGGVGSLKQKDTQGMLSKVGDRGSADPDFEPIKISKGSITSNSISSSKDNANVNNSKEHLKEEKSPVNKNFNRRGSRRVPNMNTSGFLKDVKETNAATNVSQTNAAIPKSGFFLALKLKKFANKLVTRLQSRRYLALRAKHLQFFNDKTIVPDEIKGTFKHQAHGEEGFEEQNEAYASRVKKLIDNLPLFQPSNTSKLLWDFLNMLCIAYYLIFFPLRIVFGLEIYNSFVSIVALVVISFDVMIFLNTGFYEKGALVTNRIQIFMHYLSSRFLQDFISILPFIFYDFSNVSNNMLADQTKLFESCVSLLFLIRIQHLSQIKKKIEERFYEKKTLTHIFSLFSLLLYTLYIAHLFSCAWIIIAEFKNDSSNWMKTVSIDDEEWLIKYLYSLYFLIITMTTVGYGDIRAQNSIEHLFIIVIVLISSGVFSFSINQIGQIVKQMAEEKQKVKETLQVINNYMNKKNINMSLQQQIREYLEYYLKESLMNDNETEEKIIEMLSEPLKRFLMIEANKIALKDSPIFRNNFSDTTITKTVSVIQELRCTPEEVLFYEGDTDNSAIFFIQQGKVELFIDSQNSNEVQFTSLKVFSKGSSFGEISFFTGLPRNISIRSIDFTTLLMIKRQDFINVVKDSSDDYENFCRIKDSITFLKNYDDIGIKCISCSSKDHVLNDCPYIHFVPDKEKIIKIFQLPCAAERESFDVDLRVVRFNVFDNLKQTIDDAIMFQRNNKLFLENQDWYDGNAEDEEEAKLMQDYEDEDEDDDEDQQPDLSHMQSGGNGGTTTNVITVNTGGAEQRMIYKKIDSHDQSGQFNVHTSPYKEDSYVPSSQLQKEVIKIKDDNNINNNNNLYLANNTNVLSAAALPGNSFTNFETHSMKSAYKGTTNLEVEEKRERTPSNLGINDLALTPSGLLLTLINPNPGNIKEGSQRNITNAKRKRSTSNSNLNSLSTAGPNIIYNKYSTLQGDEQQQIQGIINASSIQNNLTSIMNNNLLIQQQQQLIQQQQGQTGGLSSLPQQPGGNGGEKGTTTFSKQLSLSRGGSIVRKNTRRKNTDRTVRTNNRQASSKQTWDSKMNIIGSNGNQNTWAGERKQIKKLTVLRKGLQENQIQNTLLALQGMENMLLQNKESKNSTEFDVMKCFEIYFPHNNIDVVLFQLRKKNPHLYAKAKSFVKQSTKKLFGALTMNSQHNRMSKMDMVLQKFLMSEVDEEKDKESMQSGRIKSFTGYKSDYHRTPKQTPHQNPNDGESQGDKQSKQSLELLDQVKEESTPEEGMRKKSKTAKPYTPKSRKDYPLISDNFERLSPSHRQLEKIIHNRLEEIDFSKTDRMPMQLQETSFTKMHQDEGVSCAESSIPVPQNIQMAKKGNNQNFYNNISENQSFDVHQEVSALHSGSHLQKFIPQTNTPSPSQMLHPHVLQSVISNQHQTSKSYLQQEHSELSPKKGVYFQDNLEESVNLQL